MSLKILMNPPRTSHCGLVVPLPRTDLREMIRLVCALYRLSKNPSYIKTLQAHILDVAQFDPGHDSVLMGYDFHLSPSGPKLIEVNNNAGGLWLAWQARYPGHKDFNGRLQQQLVKMFLNEYALWRQDPQARPHTIAILDEQPTQQFLYAEMQAFAALFKGYKLNTVIVDPAELTATANGLSYQGVTIDLIYNRHCDFYLQSSALAAVKKAWLAKQVCLTPNPHTYALLADKQRLVDWSTPNYLTQLDLPNRTRALMERTLLKTRLLATQAAALVWHERKNLVFKPTTAYASRGVYLGKKITVNKFAELDTNTTLIQDYAAPSLYTSADGQDFKMDFRLFVYQRKILSVAARLYQGQVTNLRTEGGGFVQVGIV